MNGALEKFLMKAAGGAGKGLGMAKGAAQWAAKEHPVATGIGAGAAGLGGAAAAGAFDDDDSLEGILARAKKKAGGLMDDAGEFVDDAGDGIQGLLKRLGIS